jgi:Protein of unknown function (DUF3300)
MRRKLISGMAIVTAVAVALPPHGFAQPKPVPGVEVEAKEFNVEQLDAMLAPIALYPDELLTQILMASTYPLQVVQAARWLEKDDNKALKGDALAEALNREAWDPSVKSLAPFPQVLAMLNDNLSWTEQLGYAVATQQEAVMDSIQRLRRQAQQAGNLRTSKEQRVVAEGDTVVIQPADPQTVYVPSYQPAEVYGAWPYPSYPPVYFPPAPAYYAPGYVFGAGLAFAAGVAVAGGLWGWARPGWSTGSININASRYNSINVNRSAIRSGTWRAPGGGVGGRPIRPPGGPVGAPARARQLPANAIGRANVKVPGSVVNRPQIPARGGVPGTARPGGAQRPGGGAAGRAPAVLHGGAAQLPASGGRPGAGRSAAGQRPNIGQGRPSIGQRPAGAFGGIGEGAHARQYSARGMQSRGFQQSAMNRGGGSGARGGGGFAGRGGGGRGGGGGFGGRGGGGRGGRR